MSQRVLLQDNIIQHNIIQPAHATALSSNHLEHVQTVIPLVLMQETYSPGFNVNKYKYFSF